MAFRWLTILLLIAFVLPASARDFEPHASFGMKPDMSLPPQTVDMRWASAGNYGPVEGRKIRLFVLSGDGFMGDGDSRKLPVEVRRGNGRVLMFADGRWQPLRPTRLTFGPEISFGATVGEALADETVGVVVSDAPEPEAVEKAVRDAMTAAPCELEAVVLLSDDPTTMAHDFRDALHLPALPIVAGFREGEPPLSAVAPPASAVRLPGKGDASNGTDRQLLLGRLLAEECLTLMHVKQGD